MILLHNIKAGPTSNYDAPEAVEAYLREHPGVPVSCDGVYRSVFEHRDLLQGHDVTLFIIGSHVGGNNHWDHAQPFEMFCSWFELLVMERNHDFEIGWHTWTHRRLTDLTDDELLVEVTPPWPMRRFAYPYGVFDERTVEAVRRAGFTEAYTTNRGDGSAYQQRRIHL